MLRVWHSQLPAGCNLQGSSPQPRIKPLRGDPRRGEGQEGSQGWRSPPPLSSCRLTMTRAPPPSTTTSTCRRGPSSRPSAGKGASAAPAPGALPVGAELRSPHPQAGAESPLRHLPQRGGCFPGGRGEPLGGCGALGEHRVAPGQPCFPRPLPGRRLVLAQPGSGACPRCRIFLLEAPSSLSSPGQPRPLHSSEHLHVFLHRSALSHPVPAPQGAASIRGDSITPKEGAPVFPGSAADVCCRLFYDRDGAPSLHQRRGKEGKPSRGSCVVGWGAAVEAQDSIYSSPWWFLGCKRVQTPLPIPCPVCCRLPEGRALPWL